MPGTDEPDFAAARITFVGCGVEPARRSYGLVPGLARALGTEFGMAETYPIASVAYAAAAIPAGSRSGQVITARA